MGKSEIEIFQVYYSILTTKQIDVFTKLLLRTVYTWFRVSKQNKWNLLK